MFIEECSKIINNKLQAVGKEKRIAVWGAGENAIYLLRYTEILNYNFIYIIDRDKRLCGSRFFGMLVTEPDMVSWDILDVIIVSPLNGQDEIKRELKEKYCFKGTVLLIHEEMQMPLCKLISKRSLLPDEKMAPVFKKNSIYKNIHMGERAFILCTGPSIAEMELTRLKDERTIAVSGFYLHKDCQIISPDYYCIPRLEDIFDDVACELLKEIQKTMRGAKYFFNIHEKDRIEKIKEFEDESVNYVTYSEIKNYENADIDLTNNIMGPQSVTILALEIALYMGFQTIYLLGVEHDTLQTSRYTHFYDYDASIASKVNDEEDSQGNLHSAFGKQLKCISKLWEQYETLKKIAEKRGAKIYNATKGGALDVFERVDFNTLWDASIEK